MFSGYVHRAHGAVPSVIIVITVLAPTALFNDVGGLQQDVPPCLAFPLRLARLFPSLVIQHHHLDFVLRPMIRAGFRTMASEVLFPTYPRRKAVCLTASD